MGFKCSIKGCDNMNFFEKLLYMLQFEMNKPKAFGWFHLMWIGLTFFSLLILFKLKGKYGEKQLKIVLGVYGIIALIFELIKQLIWSIIIKLFLHIIIHPLVGIQFNLAQCGQKTCLI